MPSVSMTRSRRSILAGLAGAGAAAVFSRRAGAAEFSYKLGLNTPMSHPQTIRYLEAAVNIYRDSGGRLEIKVFPNDSLGTEPAMLSQLRVGALEMYSGGNGQYSEIAPVAQLDSIPFIFSDARQANAALDGGFGDYIRKGIANAGLHPLKTGWNFGFKQLIANKPITSPDDLRGTKIATRASPMFFSLWKSLGATPVSMGLAELYPALQTRLADGADQTLASVENSKFYELVHNLAITNHVWNGYTTTVNVEAWRRLPSSLQELLERDVTAAAMKERADIARAESAFPEKLKTQGMAVTKVDSRAFQNALRAGGFYTEWREKFGAEAWKAVENAAGHSLA